MLQGKHPHQRKAIARLYHLTDAAREALAAWRQATEATERPYTLTDAARAFLATWRQATEATERPYTLTDAARAFLAAWRQATEATEQPYTLTDAARAQAQQPKDQAKQIDNWEKVYLHWSDGPIPVYTEHRSMTEAEEYARELGLKTYRILKTQLDDQDY